jgi:TolB-like protein/predicted Zn-dependent protease
VKLTEGDIARNSHRTDNFEAWASATTAYSVIKHLNREDVAKGKELLEKAVKLDPKYAFAWGALGATHFGYVSLGWSESPTESFKLAVDNTDKALKIDETLSCATAIKARLYGMQRQFEKAIATGKRAIALGPSHDLSYGHLSVIMFDAGKFSESSSLMKKAMRLNPHYPAWYLYILAKSYFHEGRYEKAVDAGNRVLVRAQKGEFPPLFVHLYLSAAYIELDRREMASAHVEEVLKINPKFSLENFAKFNRFKNNSDFESYLASLRKAGLPDTPPLPLPDKPSLAVLAFDNLSGDPEQEYFGDGIAEDIISALSKSDQLFVIARNSSFTYKGKPVKVQQVGRELGVRYVLEGSVRTVEDRVRITAQLIDATTGHHLWSERYDRDLKDIFALQDEITMKIVDGLAIKLTSGEQSRMRERQYKTLEGQLKFSESLSAWNEGTDEGFIRHGQLAQELIEMEPDSPAGYSSLGWNYWDRAMQGKSPRESIGKAFQLAQKAISLDESNAFSYALLSNVYTAMRQYEKAISAGEKGVALLPNGAFNHAMLAVTLSYAEKLDEALYHIKQGIRLDPYPEYWYYWHLGRCYGLKGQYEEALAAYKKADQLNPNTWFNHFTLALTYVRLGRQEEAEAAAKKVLEINPKFSLERSSKVWPYKSQDRVKQFVEIALKAGLPK